MMLGVHCSVSGGLENAFDEAAGLGIDCMQIFTRNQRQWKAKPVSKSESDLFSAAAKKSSVKVTFSHCSYLINLASGNEELRKKSVQALLDEVVRCHALGLSYCVLHPGARGELELDTAISNIAEGLKHVIDSTAGSKVMILLENTAGQGTSVGGEFENLKAIRKQAGNTRIGYCFDTCHAFAAGFDIRTEKGFHNTMRQFDQILGLKHLKVFHLNDSKGSLGSHLDRHEHIGKGQLGLTPFRMIMHEYADIPKVIETAKEDDWDAINLKTLNQL